MKISNELLSDFLAFVDRNTYMLDGERYKIGSDKLLTYDMLATLFLNTFK